MKKCFLFVILFLLGFVSSSQNPTYKQKLYYSCKVWGFVKYYHSRVSNCEVNWDSVLVSTLPLIKNAVTKNDFNDILNTILLAAGPMAIATTPFSDTLPSELKRNRNFGWLNDSIFRPDIKVILDTIKNNFRPHSICWVQDNDYSTSYQGWLVFPHDSLMIDSNLSIHFTNEYTRLKLIFKYWNIINYFNPYNYVQDIPMDSILYHNVLSIANANNYPDFIKAFKEITSFLDDAHVEALTSYNYLNYFNHWGPQLVLKYIPITNNYVVVKSGYTFTSPILPGDIIVSIDNKTPTQWEDSLRPLISAGNISVFRNMMCQYMLCGGHSTNASIIYKDSLGNNQTRNCTRYFNIYTSWFTSYYPNDTLATVKWRKWDDCNIGYVNMGILQTTDVNTMYSDLINTSSIIFDLRNYPNGTAWPIADLMYANSKCFCKFSQPDVTYPGTFYWFNNYLGYNGNPTPYNGKVIILLNQETQSQAECSCMILEGMPNCIKVGSQTAGTDGNITYFNLSQDIQTGYTGLGTFYPNGDSTERIGIVPDSIVYLTAIGIRHGRDEILEKALKIADCFLSIPNINASSQPNLTLYPNPTKGIITFEKNVDIDHIEVYNLIGDKIYNSIFREIIDLSSLPIGMYYVKFINKGKMIGISKVVVD